MVDTGLRPGRRRPVGSRRPAGLIRRLISLSLWRDPVGLACLAASLIGLVALTGYVHAWMPSLPNLLPLHYNSAGSVDLIGPRTDLYKMPGIGGIVLLADLVLASALHRRERLAALILLSASVLVQLMLLVATINIIRLAFGD